MMPESHTKIYVHLVLVTKSAQKLIDASWKNMVCQNIVQLVMKKGHKLECINGMEDHFHLCIAFHQMTDIPELVREIKTTTTRFINERKLCSVRFEWQRAYGAFSLGSSQLEKIIRFIENQETYHCRYRFEEEYLFLLKKYDIEHRPEAIFPKENHKRQPDRKLIPLQCSLLL